MFGMSPTSEQGMAPRVAAAEPGKPYQVFQKFSGEFVAPVDGIVTVFAWGGGGAGATSASTYGGNSGAAGKRTTNIKKGQTVVVSLGSGGTSEAASGSATYVQFPDGVTMTANGGLGGGTSLKANATCSGGDQNVVGGQANSGAGAPPPGLSGFDPYIVGGASGQRNESNPSSTAQRPAGSGVAFGAGGGSRGGYGLVGENSQYFGYGANGDAYLVFSGITPA